MNRLVLFRCPEHKKLEFIKKIKKLKGQYLESNPGVEGFPVAATHLIVFSWKNAKEFILTALAAGKFVVKPEFVECSFTNGDWLPENGYFFEKTHSNVLARRIANNTDACLQRYLAHFDKSGGFFAQWKVGILIDNPDQKAMWGRIVKGGRGKYIKGVNKHNCHFPYLHRDLTHVFFEEDKPPCADDVHRLLEAGVAVLPTLFLEEYVFCEQPVDHIQHYRFSLTYWKLRNPTALPPSNQETNNNVESAALFGKSLTPKQLVDKIAVDEVVFLDDNNEEEPTSSTKNRLTDVCSSSTTTSGRRRLFPESAADDIENLNCSSIKQEKVDDAVPNRRRGRPRGSKTRIEIAEKANGSPSSKRTRGRPPKTKAVEYPTVSCDSLTFVSIHSNLEENFAGDIVEIDVESSACRKNVNSSSSVPKTTSAEAVGLEEGNNFVVPDELIGKIVDELDFLNVVPTSSEIGSSDKTGAVCSKYPFDAAVKSPQLLSHDSAPTPFNKNFLVRLENYLHSSNTKTYPSYFASLAIVDVDYEENVNPSILEQKYVEQINSRLEEGEELLNEVLNCCFALTTPRKVPPAKVIGAVARSIFRFQTTDAHLLQRCNSYLLNVTRLKSPFLETNRAYWNSFLLSSSSKTCASEEKLIDKVTVFINQILKHSIRDDEYVTGVVLAFRLIVTIIKKEFSGFLTRFANVRWDATCLSNVEKRPFVALLIWPDCVCHTIRKQSFDLLESLVKLAALDNFDLIKSAATLICTFCESVRLEDLSIGTIVDTVNVELSPKLKIFLRQLKSWFLRYKVSMNCLRLTWLRSALKEENL